MNEIVERVKQLEILFSDNGYNGSGDNAFFIEEGSIPVIVSAPHAINQFRAGQMKLADVYTGGIARYLHEVTDCHIICSSRFTESDPNYDPVGKNKYQDTLKEYLEKHPVSVLLDLHGTSQTREYAVELGTAPEQVSIPGKQCEEDPSLHEYKFIAEMIKNIFADQFKELPTVKKEIWKNQIFSAGNQNTVTKFISKNTHTACIQLEINRNYRDPENETEFVSLTEGLIKTIDTLSHIDWNSIPVVNPLGQK